jgi:hypothetical protein
MAVTLEMRILNNGGDFGGSLDVTIGSSIQMIDHFFNGRLLKSSVSNILKGRLLRWVAKLQQKTSLMS